MTHTITTATLADLETQLEVAYDEFNSACGAYDDVVANRDLWADIADRSLDAADAMADDDIDPDYGLYHQARDEAKRFDLLIDTYRRMAESAERRYAKITNQLLAYDKQS